MNRLAILEQNNAQGSIFHFRDARPTANSSIGLYLFKQWFFDNTFDPFIQMMERSGRWRVY
jgi:hypothetical protein